jgi:hypothetical protein
VQFINFYCTLYYKTRLRIDPLEGGSTVYFHFTILPRLGEKIEKEQTKKFKVACLLHESI